MVHVGTMTFNRSYQLRSHCEFRIMFLYQLYLIYSLGPKIIMTMATDLLSIVTSTSTSTLMKFINDAMNSTATTTTLMNPSDNTKNQQMSLSNATILPIKHTTSMGFMTTRTTTISTTPSFLKLNRISMTLMILTLLQRPTAPSSKILTTRMV